MDRRDALQRVAGGLSVLVPFATGAQPGPRPRRLAFLSAFRPGEGERFRDAFFGRLLELGWVDGRNLVVDIRYSEGDHARAESLTRELLALKPDVISVGTDVYATHAARMTRTVPVVFGIGSDPVGRGLVQSLARPGGNVTGISVLTDELVSKRLDLLKQIVPALRKVGALYIASAPQAQAALAATVRVGRAAGLDIVPMPVRGRDDLEPVIAGAPRSGLQALANVSDTFFLLHRVLLAELCIRHGLVAIGASIENVDAGLLMAYAADQVATLRRSADLVDRILRGASPAEIPVEQASVYEFVVNQKTARALGVAVPGKVLLQATRVIE